MPYDVTILTVQPAVMPRALAGLQTALADGASDLLACWYSEIGALNQIMIIRNGAQSAEQRMAALRNDNPYGIGDLMTATVNETYESFPFIPPMKAGSHGPFFEVRTYLLKPGALTGTLDRWEKALPERLKRSPILAAMHSVSGPIPSFIHIWPYKSLDERHQVRSKAVADKIWPPPGGAGTLLTQQTDIYVAAPFSPIK